jgi:hypothetical protein
MRTKLIAGNWKMHKTVSEAVALIDALHAALPTIPADREVVVCPTFTALSAVAARPRGGIGIGAQNVYPESHGAYTGEISPAMLVDIGCRYVIIGHSERRALFGESDAFIAKKAYKGIFAPDSGHSFQTLFGVHISFYNYGIVHCVLIGNSIAVKQKGKNEDNPLMSSSILQKFLQCSRRLRNCFANNLFSLFLFRNFFF